MIGDIDKFSISQMLSNSDGKTSASGTMASLTVIVGLLGFTIGVVKFAAYDGKADVLMYSTAMVTTGLSVLGYRKSKDVITAASEIQAVEPEKTAAK